MIEGAPTPCTPRAASCPKVAKPSWLDAGAPITLNIMNARARQLLDELLRLSAEDRALIASELDARLEQDSPEEVEKAWAEVIERRARVVLAGRSAASRDAFEVLDEIEARLRSRR